MFTLTAVKQLLNKGIHVELLCINESRLHVEAVNAGYLTHPVKVTGYLNMFSVPRIYNIIKKNSYDIIHTQASKDLWLLVPALKIGGMQTPLIMTKQVGSFVNKKDILHKWLYERLTLALAISNVIKKNLADTCPLTEDKILLLHNGVDTGIFDPEKVSRKKIRSEFNIRDDEILIGMMARFSPGKGHEEFLSAAAELNGLYGNLRFIAVGEASRGENSYADRIKQNAADLKIDNIIFAGYRSDTPEVLAALDIFVFPSHNEAFGIALTEAMAMGKPSVCSNSDGILDIALDGETSLLFEVKNHVDLKNKIATLISSPELRLKLGTAARKRAVDNFDIEMLTGREISIYKQAIKI